MEPAKAKGLLTDLFYRRNTAVKELSRKIDQVFQRNALFVLAGYGAGKDERL